MPITAERVMSILDGTREILRHINELRLTNENQKVDIGKLERRLRELQIQDEKLQEIIYSINNSCDSVLYRRINDDLIHNLYSEKAHFEANWKKNKSMKDRMRAKRALNREVEWERNYYNENQIQEKPPTKFRDPDEVLREMEEEERMKNRRTNGKPDGK